MDFPKATIGSIIGLLNAVKDAGGAEDAARLARDFGLELKELLPSISGAELLGFAVVKDGSIRLTKSARVLLSAGIQERNRAIGESVGKVDLIRELAAMLRGSAGRRMRKADALKLLKKIISTTDIESYFDTIINWGGFCGIGYDSDSGEIFLLDKS